MLSVLRWLKQAMCKHYSLCVAVGSFISSSFLVTTVLHEIREYFLANAIVWQILWAGITHGIKGLTHTQKTETERNEYICWGATRESWTNNILTNFTYVRWKTERQMLWHWFFFGFSQSASKQSAQFQNNVIPEMHVMTAFIWRLARARGRKNMFAFHLTFTREFVR